MKMKAIAVFLLFSGTAYAQGIPAVAGQPAPTRVFAGAKIFIEDQNEFSMALGASFIEKKVPVTVFNVKEKADFILKVTSEDRKASTAGKLFGVARDRFYGTVSIFNQEGALVFAYSVKKGTFQDAANSTANEIKKKQIEGR
jgi:hypothetical protein